MQKRHSWGLIDSATLGLDDSVLDLVTHADAVATTDFVCLVEKCYSVFEVFAIDCNRATLHELDGYVFAVDAQ